MKTKIKAYIIEQQREYTQGSTAYNLLRKLETVIPNMIEEPSQSNCIHCKGGDCQMYNSGEETQKSAIPIQGIPPQFLKKRVIGRFKEHIYSLAGLITTGYRVMVMGIKDIKIYEQELGDMEHLIITPAYHSKGKGVFTGYYFEIAKCTMCGTKMKSAGSDECGSCIDNGIH